MASRGVLFFDEVAEMSLAGQVKLLRFLQEREYQRLGATRPQKANVRVIAASNRDPDEAVQPGVFREDLLYRLRVFDITRPPLRDRVSDIPLLADAFLVDIAQRMERRPPQLTDDALDAPMAHDWPGNVRELQNALERAAILTDADIEIRHLSLRARNRTSTAPDLGAMERGTIERTLAETDWNKSKTARRLGLSRTQLYGRLRRYGLDDPPDAALV